jgi:hypothetical protein
MLLGEHTLVITAYLFIQGLDMAVEIALEVKSFNVKLDTPTCSIEHEPRYQKPAIL